MQGMIVNATKVWTKFGVALLLAATPAFAADWTAGHGDIGIAYEGGAWDLHVHLEGGTVDAVIYPDEEFEAGDIRIVLPHTTAEARPAGAAFDFIGVSAGETHWKGPQTALEAAGDSSPFVGIATEEIELGDFIGDSITLALTGVISAPAGGEFSLWQAGPIRYMDTADASFANDSFAFPVGAHDHFNYSFTKPGLYELEFTASGTHVTDGFTSASEVYTFLVLPEPGSLLMLGLGAAMSVGMRNRRRSVSC